MKRHGFILASIILLGILLRLFILSQRGSFEFDEAFSAHFAAMDFNELWAHLKFENNPPGYFVLLHFWMQWFGNTDLAARSLSMVFGIGSIPLLYAIGVKLAGRRAGLFAAFLLAISTLPVFYSTEARMYALYLFLTLAAVWCFVRINHQDLKKGRQFYILNSTFYMLLLLLVWTHVTAWLIVIALVFYLFWQQKFKVKQTIIPNSLFIILTGALILTAYTPLLKQVNRQWDDLAVWVERIENEKCKIENDCVILVHPHSEVLPFERYWRGKLPVVGFYPEADADSKNLRIVKTNWKNLVTKENVRALADVVSEFNQVMLILGETDRTDAPELVKQWFWENGWRRQGGAVFGPLEAVTLEH